MQPTKRLRATLLATCLIAPALAAITPTLASAQDRTPTPSIVHVEKESRYVSVIWRSNDRIKGVNVYRDGQWLASVNSPNNVYNDYGGREGATYELIAYGYDDSYSNRAAATARNDEMDPVVDVNVEILGGNRAVLNWTRANNEVTGWWIYRNGSIWRYLPVGQGHKDEIFDTDAGNAFVYEVQAVRGSLHSPRSGTLGSAVNEYLTVSSTGRSAVKPWPGDNRPPVEGLPARDAKTRSLAASAEASSATAQKEHEDFENARHGLATAVGGLAVPQTGGVANPRNWFSVGVAGVEARAQRMEAEAANKKAFDDLKAYQDCMASNCGAPPPSDGDGPGTDEQDPDYAPGYGPANPGGDEPGTPF